MNYILFDDSRRDNLLPLTFMRPVADLRTGILTIREKWELYLGAITSSLTEEYLSEKFPLVRQDNNILINGSVLPNRRLADRVMALQPNQALVDEDCIIAMHLTSEEIENVQEADFDEIQYDDICLAIRNTWDIFAMNEKALEADFKLVTQGRKSMELNSTNTLINKELIFAEEGAVVNCSVLNASHGPIYIGQETEIMEGSLIRGPFALCKGSVIKMAAKIYGPTTIGPYSKAGGELNNVVMLGHTNKAHDGFLGHSVLGEWCNIGADTNTSNLKNTYENVKLWSYSEESFVDTGLQFCGLIMGDHSKTGINTMFNTGTVVGVNCNVFGSGFQRNFIPSFAWGGITGFKEYKISEAVKVAERVYARRGMEYSDIDRNILTAIYDLSYRYRKNF